MCSWWGEGRALIGGGCIFIYSWSARLISSEISFISKEISRAEPEYMNYTPTPISTLASPLRSLIFGQHTSVVSCMYRSNHAFCVTIERTDSLISVMHIKLIFNCPTICLICVRIVVVPV